MKTFVFLITLGIFMVCVRSEDKPCKKVKTKAALCELLQLAKQPKQPAQCDVDLSSVLDAISTLGSSAEAARNALKEHLDQKFDQLGQNIVKELQEALERLRPTKPPTTQPPKEYKSCSELYADGARESKTYELSLEGGKTSVYCHMGEISGCGSGGFTMVMKIDGNEQTFKYDAPLWTNKEAYNAGAGASGFDDQETKLPIYWEMAFNKVCLGMKVGDQTKFLSLDMGGASLHALIADGQHRASSLGRDAWKGLVPGSSLQSHCNREGFNAKANDGMSMARIGISSNNENDCSSNDSRIGFGTGGYPDNDASCGNVAQHGGDNGDKNIKGFGYILVQ